MTRLRDGLILLLLVLPVTATATDLAYLVKDLNTNTAAYGSNPDHFLAFGSLAIFETTDFYGDSLGLWRTDGADSGTYAIGPAAFSKVIWNGRIWFVRGGFGVSRLELWSTDGNTEAVHAMTVAPGTTGITSLMAAGSYLYFVQSGKLWRTQGTSATTFQVSPTTFGGAGHWADLGGNLYFAAGVPGGGSGLWRANAGGLVLVYDLGTASSQYFLHLKAAGSQLFMYAYAGATTGLAELWRSDGTAAGTRRIKSTQPITRLQYPQILVTSATHAYFVGDDGTGLKLWSTDGTDAGTVVLSSSMPGAASSFTGIVIGRLANGTLIVLGPTLGGSPNSRALWSFNGTNTTFLADVPNGNASSSATVAGSYVLYGSGDQLWRTDGTIGGTYNLGTVNGSDGYHNWPMTAVGTNVLFGAVDPTYGRELWKTDGTQPNTLLLKDLVVATYSSYPASLRRLGAGVVFTATADSTTDGQSTGTRDLWFSNGTAEGTWKLRDAVGYPREFVTCGPRVYFTHSTPETGNEFWSTDGTPGGTQIVRDLVPGPGSASIGPIVCAGDQLYFISTVNGVTTLFKTDGSAAGTLPIRAVPTTSGDWPSALYSDGRHVYYSALRQLWRSDGTPAGTTLVKDIAGSITHAVASGTILYFTTREGGQTSLWRTDGTSAGTSTFLTDDWVTLYTVFLGEAVFHWQDGYTNVGLCRSSGATTPVCFDPDFYSTGGVTVRPVNGRLLFNIPEVKISDGFTTSSAGIGDVDTFLSNAGGREFATRDDLASLIETDGTPANTREILGGRVDESEAGGGRLFISRGELYAYDLPVTVVSFAPSSIQDGGQTITISGRGFTTPVTLTVDGTPVTATFVSSTTLTFVAPPLPPGAYPIAMTLGDGRELRVDEPLRYVCTKPSAAVDPVTGVLPFGSSVALHGSGGVSCAWFPGTGLDDPGSCTPNASPQVSTTYTLVVFSANGCASANHPSVRVAIQPATPSLQYANRKNSTSVAVTFSAAIGATAYEVVRTAAGGAPPVVTTITSTSTSSVYHTDSAPAGGTYVYRIRATNADGASPYSNADWTSTVTYSDNPLLRRTPVRALHFSELRKVIDDIGVLVGLPPASWTDPVITPGSTVIRAAHLLELRAHFAAICAAVGKPAPSWPSGAVSAGTLFQVTPIFELRNATD